jgi:hypothetical protein
VRRHPFTISGGTSGWPSTRKGCPSCVFVGLSCYCVGNHHGCPCSPGLAPQASRESRGTPGIGVRRTAKSGRSGWFFGCPSIRLGDRYSPPHHESHMRRAGMAASYGDGGAAGGEWRDRDDLVRSVRGLDLALDLNDGPIRYGELSSNGAVRTDSDIHGARTSSGHHRSGFADRCVDIEGPLPTASSARPILTPQIVTIGPSEGEPQPATPATVATVARTKAPRTNIVRITPCTSVNGGSPNSRTEQFPEVLYCAADPTGSVRLPSRTRDTRSTEAVPTGSP